MERKKNNKFTVNDMRAFMNELLLNHIIKRPRKHYKYLIT